MGSTANDLRLHATFKFWLTKISLQGKNVNEVHNYSRKWMCFKFLPLRASLFFQSLVSNLYVQVTSIELCSSGNQEKYIHHTPAAWFSLCARKATRNFQNRLIQNLSPFNRLRKILWPAQLLTNLLLRKYSLKWFSWITSLINKHILLASCGWQKGPHKLT